MRRGSLKISISHCPGRLQIWSDRDDQIGPKIKTQKIPRAPNKTAKTSLDQKLTPKKSHSEFLCLKSLQKGKKVWKPRFVGTITKFRVFWVAKKIPILNSSHPKQYLPYFTTPNNPRIKNFKPQKIIWSSLSLEIWIPPPGFGLKWYGLCRLCLSGMVFYGTMEVYECIYHFSSKWPRKKEKYANLKRF